MNATMHDATASEITSRNSEAGAPSACTAYGVHHADNMKSPVTAIVHEFTRTAFPFATAYRTAK